MKPSTRQRVLDYVACFWTMYHYAPTPAEIAIGIGLGSEEAVRYHLKALRADHKIEWRGGASRSIRLLGGQL